MPRATLIVLVLSAIATVPAFGQVAGAHLDPILVPEGCPACHEGHGASGSPMLPSDQESVCMKCHDGMSQAGRTSGLSRSKKLAGHQQFGHPLTKGAYSRDNDGVTCSSCHSPHRAMPKEARSGPPKGNRKPSPRADREFEFELCEGCHGRYASGRGANDIGSLLNPSNASYHPVHAPTSAGSPSVEPSLAGREINCTDCHGNDRPDEASGLHSSSVRYVLRAQYRTENGNAESEESYALCYSCHDRKLVLGGTTFPEHDLHVRKLNASCATCHDPHGSISNRALIRLGDDEHLTNADVGPSATAGVIGFVSESPGSGSCYVTCHGYDHGPSSYGFPNEAMTVPTLAAPASPRGRGVRPTTLTRPGTATPIRPRSRDPFEP